MAAQVLARRIGHDLYRVDLSRVVSKYIGETEKNLDALFEEAAAANAILFFDEADALFSRRTEVRDAHDRYANVETGFLLQRMESHPGISILATNLRKNLDDAFLRRLHVVAEFPLPAQEERAAIWRRLLPTEVLSAPSTDVDLLARSFAVSGGDIRNAVMAALLLSARENSQLTMRYLVIGLWRELQKSGRLIDPSHFGPWKSVVVGLSPRGQYASG
jgi:SpoVK/Ycf46/Vps4 family AAA+-type ATPase